jgi:hypothetical protein
LARVWVGIARKDFSFLSYLRPDSLARRIRVFYELCLFDPVDYSGIKASVVSIYHTEEVTQTFVNPSSHHVVPQELGFLPFCHLLSSFQSFPVPVCCICQSFLLVKGRNWEE